MILGIVIGVVLMVVLILVFAAGYVTAVQKIKPLDEESDQDDR